MVGLTDQVTLSWSDAESGNIPELDPVVNAFDPWARKRGEYYSLEWAARPGAETDEAFPK